MSRAPTLGRLAVVVALLAPAACRVTDLPLWGPTGPLAADVRAVEVVRDVAYYDGPGADDHRHRADLFVPRGPAGFPVVVLVHGGAWMIGDNRCCGLYSAVGECLARQGVGVVVPNYRLSPRVKHPEHVRDVARAVAWTRAHIADHGGDPDCLVLVGHSAGGHLVALLATDEQYLRAEGQRAADVRGVVAVSGVYDVPPATVAVTLGGSTDRAVRLDEAFPVRGGAKWACSGLPGLPVALDPFAPAFGVDPAARAAAAPINHVRPGLPPFLLLSADNDLPVLPDMAADFARALRAQGGAAEHRTVADRNHNSVLFRAADPDDPAAQAILAFVRRHAGPR